MEVILLEKIENLGVMGDKVNIKPGYGRNYLIPKGKAAPATEANIAAFEARLPALRDAKQHGGLAFSPTAGATGRMAAVLAKTM